MATFNYAKQQDIPLPVFYLPKLTAGPLTTQADGALLACILIISNRVLIEPTTQRPLKTRKGLIKNGKLRISPTMTKYITQKNEYKGLQVNNGKYRNLGLYTCILESIYDQLLAIQSHHSRIWVVRFDLHVPHTNFSASSTWNQELSEFWRIVKKRLATKACYRIKEVAFCWCREVADRKHEHYHCYIAFKHETVSFGSFSSQRYTGLWGVLQNAWIELTGGFLEPVKSYTLNRGDAKTLHKVFKHLSYMAKVKTKDFGTGATHKRYNASRLRPNPDKLPTGGLLGYEKPRHDTGFSLTTEPTHNLFHDLQTDLAK